MECDSGFRVQGWAKRVENDGVCRLWLLLTGAWASFLLLPRLKSWGF